ncbi:hypothetical protein FISHEDRAFT_72570 [Fistulina hepatica ATCC 64428]|nr:hypothetical protein FISHEDRAFT_72570 [Fistulina hepatica ATCC 64428]
MIDPPDASVVIQRFKELATVDADAIALQIQASALVTQLKSLNRLANSATRLRKEESAQARAEMDAAHLGLQNLLYEKRHLEREIEKCRQFITVYQDVPLYDMEEFVRLAPEEARTETVLQDEHQLMLNRLSFELAERQRQEFFHATLDQRLIQLQAQKEELLRGSSAKAAKMKEVFACIEDLCKYALETQKKIDTHASVVLPDDNDIVMS